MKYVLSGFLLLLITSYIACGQTSDETRSQSGDLSLRVKSMNFVEDNEFFNPIVKGYTLLGFFIQPELIYRPSPKVSLNAGIHLLKYYGTEKFSQVRPVFSTILNFSKQTTLTLGTLSGPDKHQMFDPHFYSERLYNQYVEDGIQLTHFNKHIFTDTWISWENFIFKGDSTREQFTMGQSFRYTSDSYADFIYLEIPFQLQLKHMGGQINDSQAKTESFLNFAGGIRVNLNLAGMKYGQTGIEYLQFLNTLSAGDSIAGIGKGRASWTRLFYNYKAVHFETGYWASHDFYAPNGNPIFSSISDYNPGVVIHNRRIITTSGSIRFFPANALELFFGVDLYYDIDRNRIDQAYTIHLNFDKLIKLTGRKNRSGGL
jgi:hypothetical protein